MRSLSLILVVSAVCSLSLPGSARAADCLGSGYRSTFGANAAAYFEVKSGEACTYAFDMGGVVSSSRILTAPKNGTVRMLNLTSFEFRAKPGYRGQDSFSIEATGSNQTGSGVSILTMNVMIE